MVEIPEYDVLVIGAGMSGCYACHRMHELNRKVRVLEAGSGPGGTWYWNRYPGARFDSESYSYGFFFSKEVLDEWTWTEHFAGSEETERYIRFLCDKFNLWKDIQFHTRVSSAHWIEPGGFWRLTDTTGHEYTSRFLITGVGVLSNPTLPNVPGVKDFKGEAYHTSGWPKQKVRFEGKRVGVIGTGATAIQLIPEVAKTCKSLTVLQRTPNWALPLHNGPIEADEMEIIRTKYPDLLKQINKSPLGFLHDLSPKSIWKATPEERDAFWEYLYKQKGFAFWISNYKEAPFDRKANALVSDFVAKKIRERVKDPATAEKLIPTTYGFGTRRVPMESGFYEAFNRENVRLVDVNATPIKRITTQGVETSEEDFEFDILVYATGFSAITGGFDLIDFRGLNGVPLLEKWQDGPRTFLGLTVKDFPNMFMSLGPHQAFGNIARSIEYAVDWMCDCLTYMQAHNLTYIEPTQESVDEWTAHVFEVGANLLSNEVDSWMTGVNKNLPHRQKRSVVRYAGSAPGYRRRADKVAQEKYKAFLLKGNGDEKFAARL